MASPNKKPLELKKLQGTVNSTRDKPGSKMKPQKVEGVPEPPEYLGEHGKELWNQQLSQLVNLGMLTVVDLNALAQYCKQWDIWRMAEENLRDGYKNKHDQVSADVTVLYKAEAAMLKIADRFGFTASARMKLDVKDEKPNDPLAEHLGKKSG